MKKLTLFFGIAVIFLSCEKEGNNLEPQIIENSDMPLISKVLIGGELYMEYTYNQSNQVEEEKSKFFYTKHNFNADNQLSSSDFYFDASMASSSSYVIEAAMARTWWVNPDNTPKSLSQEFLYNTDGHLFRKIYNRTGDPSVDVLEFQYEGGRIIKSTGYYNGVQMTFTTYEYDNKGNVAKELRYIISSDGITELATTTEYEYDDMHNPFLAFKRLIDPGVNTNPNNIVKKTYTLNFEVDPYIEKVQVTNNTYEYNEAGYPVKVNKDIVYQYN